MPAPALLDLSRLEIALGGDTSMIGDILEMYESTAQADLDALADALKAGDALGGTRKAHSLKGASANVGADQVAAIAADIEHACRDGHVAQAAARLADLTSTFDQTLQASRAHRAA